MRVTESKASIALSPSRLPGLDWALNPYRGCGHACVYCYSPDVLRLDGKEPWGSFVDVRRNLPVLLAREKKNRAGVVGIGTVTDPYQPLEEKAMLTRYCLEQLAAGDCTVCIQTKSDLVIRDIDILRKMKEPEVGLTVTTMDAELAGRLEPGAPPPARRIAALGKLSDAGISTWLFLGPVIPGLNDGTGQLAEVIEAAKAGGCRKVMYDRLRLKPMVLERMRKWMGQAESDRVFGLAGDSAWQARVSAEIEKLCNDAGIVAEKSFR
jgi:DNA repair photolyase